MYHQSNEQVAPGGFAPTEARAFRALVMAQTVDFVTDLIRKQQTIAVSVIPTRHFFKHALSLLFAERSQ